MNGTPNTPSPPNPPPAESPASPADALQLLTIEEACVALRITVSAINVYNKQGRLPFVRVGKLRRVRLSDLRKFIQEEGPKA
ncbi:MAG TPA: helix-turn-helix domain-containing protein [Phycisphaerales bacterium]|nr:helix-turn-helix domain-containing protein [Phycisphaerales bacterium]